MINLGKLVHLLAMTLVLMLPAITKGGIIGVSWDFVDSAVHSIDEVTGVGTLIGFAGVNRLNSLARNKEGSYYSVGGKRDDLLVTIDSLTGAATPIATLSKRDIRDLAFSQTDVLYGIFEDGPNELVRIDTHSGLVTLVGKTGFYGIQAIAFAPDGRLYGWEVGTGSGVGVGLVSIDIQTGAAIDVNPLINGGAHEVQGMSFSRDGKLFGANRSLYTIDVTNGTLSPVGSGGYADVRGIAFSPSQASVPEPATFAVFAVLGLAIMCASRPSRYAQRISVIAACCISLTACSRNLPATSSPIHSAPVVTAEAFQEFYMTMSDSFAVSDVAYHVTVTLTNQGSSPIEYDCVQTAFIPAQGKPLVQKTVLYEKDKGMSQDAYEAGTATETIMPGDSTKFEITSNGYTNRLLRDARDGPIQFVVVFLKGKEPVEAVVGPFGATLDSLEELPQYEVCMMENRLGKSLPLRSPRKTAK